MNTKMKIEKSYGILMLCGWTKCKLTPQINLNAEHTSNFMCQGIWHRHFSKYASSIFGAWLSILQGNFSTELWKVLSTQTTEIWHKLRPSPNFALLSTFFFRFCGEPANHFWIWQLCHRHLGKYEYCWNILIRYSPYIRSLFESRKSQFFLCSWLRNAFQHITY